MQVNELHALQPALRDLREEGLLFGPIAADEQSQVGKVAVDAAEVDSAAIAVTAELGEQTVAKGVARLCRNGRKPPSRLRRRLRELDAAAALVRHPGAPLAIVADLREWLGREDGQRSTNGIVEKKQTKSTDANNLGGNHHWGEHWSWSKDCASWQTPRAWEPSGIEDKLQLHDPWWANRPRATRDEGVAHVHDPPATGAAEPWVNWSSSWKQPPQCWADVRTAQNVYDREMAVAREISNLRKAEVHDEAAVLVPDLPAADGEAETKDQQRPVSAGEQSNNPWVRWRGSAPAPTARRGASPAGRGALLARPGRGGGGGSAGGGGGGGDDNTKAKIQEEEHPSDQQRLVGATGIPPGQQRLINGAGKQLEEQATPPHQQRCINEAGEHEEQARVDQQCLINGAGNHEDQAKTNGSCKQHEVQKQLSHDLLNHDLKSSSHDCISSQPRLNPDLNATIPEQDRRDDDGYVWSSVETMRAVQKLKAECRAKKAAAQSS